MALQVVHSTHGQGETDSASRAGEGEMQQSLLLKRTLWVLFGFDACFKYFVNSLQTVVLSLILRCGTDQGVYGFYQVG